MKSYLWALLVVLCACGVEKTPKLMEDTNQNMKDANQLMIEFDSKLEQFLESCYVYVFKHDIISPYQKDFKPKVYFEYKVFDPSQLKPLTQKLEISTLNFEIHYSAKTETAYYVVPEAYRTVVPASAVKKFAKTDSLCASIEEMIETQVESAKEGAENYLEENEDVIFQKIADVLEEVEERRIDCKEYELELAKNAYLDSQIKWYQFKAKKDQKLRNKMKELEKEMAPHPCDKTAFNISITKEEALRLTEKHSKDWSLFYNSWTNYYTQWQTDRSLFFNVENREKIIIPEFTNTRVKALYQLRKEEFAQKFKLLDLAQGFLPVENPQKLKKFLVNNEKGMRIDPSVTVDYEQVPIERIEVLATIFKRYFYSGNTKSEKENIRFFIVDAVFLLFEQQLEAELIENQKSQE